MDNENKRDIVSRYFQTEVGVNEIDPVAVDNILIARPEMYSIIESYHTGCTGNRVLDYGCGSGGFMIDLSKKGYQVIGIDTSKNMCALATENILKIKSKSRRNLLKIIHGDSLQIERSPNVIGNFNLIVSLMSFQFISDAHIQKTIQNLEAGLGSDGLFLFAAWNVNRIKEGIEGYNQFYHKGNSNDGTIHCSVNFNGTRIDSYNRTVDIYDHIFSKLGYEKVHEANPVFPLGFFEKYNWKYPRQNSEYLILAYKKNNL